MKKTTRTFAVVALVLGLSAVAAVLTASATDVEAATGGETAVSNSVTQDSATSLGEYAEGVVEILLGDSTTVTGEGAAVEGSKVIITAAGVYRLTGTLTDGQVEIDAKGKVYLELAGAEISSSSGPALKITDAKKVTLTLAEDTVNSLSDADSDSLDDAALFTNDTLVINGKGTLVVVGNNNEGISSDDDIIINSGTVRVTAVDDGLNAHDDVTINDGDIIIRAGGDGVDSNGTVHLNGGSLVCCAGTGDGDRGIDAVGELTISGGSATLSGNSMTLPDEDSSQCSLYVATGTIWPAGTLVRVERDGDEILSFAPEGRFQSLLLSPGGLVAGAAYQVYVGDSSVPVTAMAEPCPSSEAGVSR